jgi:hypothetical protein
MELPQVEADLQHVAAGQASGAEVGLQAGRQPQPLSTASSGPSSRRRHLTGGSAGATATANAEDHGRWSACTTVAVAKPAARHHIAASQAAWTTLPSGSLGDAGSGHGPAPHGAEWVGRADLNADDLRGSQGRSISYRKWDGYPWRRRIRPGVRRIWPPVCSEHGLICH